MAWLWSWNPWSDFSHRGAKKQGRIDGRKGIPTQDQEHNPPYVMSVKQVGEQIILQLAQEWERKDANLFAEYCKAMKEAQRIAEWEDKAKLELKTSERERVKAREEYIKHFHISPVAYLVLLFFLSVAEFFFNTVVFQLFGENQAATIMTALGIALAFPVLAHALGGWLRHGFLLNRKFSIHTALILLNISVVVGGLLGIAYVREKFMEGQQIDRVLGIELDPTVVTAVFLVLNLVLFVATTVLSYIEHNPEANQYRLRYRDANKLYKRSNRRLKELVHLDTANQNRRARIRSERENLFQLALHEVKERKDNTQMLISIYRMENLRTRDSQEQPRCFNTYPPIDSPKELDPDNPTIDWDCSRFLDLDAEVLELDARSARISDRATSSSS